MGINLELAQKAEKLAKEIASVRFGSEGLWELVLMEAYEIIARREECR